MTGRQPSLRATRRRIIELLRRGPLTIRDVADRLTLTASGVRVHMAALERQGLVQQAGVARGLNRPAAIYELAPGVDALLCSAYVPFVANLLGTLGEELPDDAVATLMQSAGRRLAASFGQPSGTLRERAEAASSVLNRLGAITEVETDGERISIAGADCPLAQAVRESPAVCQAMESFVAELVQEEVHECCDRGGRARCRFEIVQSDESERPAQRSSR